MFERGGKMCKNTIVVVEEIMVVEVEDFKWK